MEPGSGSGREYEPAIARSGGVSISLAAEASSVGLARQFVTESVKPLIDDPADVGLATSELVANVVTHTDTPVTVTVRRGPPIRVEVRDGIAATTAFRNLVSNARMPVATAPNGRGVALVRAVASRVGLEDDPGGGKVVWCEFDIAIPRRQVSDALKIYTSAAQESFSTGTRSTIDPMQDEVLARRVVDLLAGRTIATAESCTAGRIAEVLACVENAAEFLRGGMVAYQDEIKRSLLGVTSESVLTAEAAAEMAGGAARLFGADVSVATTGVAGDEPEDGTEPGTVYIATFVDGTTTASTHRFDGTPEQVCDQARAQALLDLVHAMGDNDGR